VHRGRRMELSPSDQGHHHERHPGEEDAKHALFYRFLPPQRPVWLKYSADSTLLIFVRLVVRCVDP
jgi:hypothetical protein